MGNPQAKPEEIIVGDLVFIKQEGDKHKARERYIVTKVENNKATLQKITQKFMARTYLVPLSHLYLAQGKGQSKHSIVSKETSDSESDEDYIDGNEDNNSDIAEQTESDDHSPDNDSESENNEDTYVSEPPQRTRRQPAWVTSGEYEL